MLYNKETVLYTTDSLYFLLEKMKNTLIIGASTKSDRTSFQAIHRLRNEGISVYALGIRSGKVADINIFTSPEEMDLPNIHTVSLYINPSHQPAYYNWIIQLKPERVIFNPGTENPEFVEKLGSHGIGTNAACTLVMLSLAMY